MSERKPFFRECRILTFLMTLPLLFIVILIDWFFDLSSNVERILFIIAIPFVWVLDTYVNKSLNKLTDTSLSKLIVKLHDLIWSDEPIGK